MSDKTTKKDRVGDKMNSLVGCPFCGCEMGHLTIGGGYQWFGFHKSGCILEGNPSASWGRLEDMTNDWNKRTPND